MTAQSVTLSLPELNSLCLRAARGAGYSWGLAEDFGFAAEWLSQRQINGAEVALQRLTGPKGAAPSPAPIRWDTPHPLCGLTAGVTLADFAALPEGVGTEGVALGTVLTPMIALPHIAQAAATIGATCDIARESQPWASIGADGSLELHGDTIGDAAALVITRGTRSPPPRPLAANVNVQPTTYAALTALALKMTVPASDTSHAGAGGTGSDNE